MAKAKLNIPTKLLYVDKHIDSKRVAKEKTFFLVREDNVSISEKLGMELVKQAEERDIKIQYDITYGGHPHELAYTEFFGSLGGIYVRPCCGKMIDFLISKDYDTSNNVDFSRYITERPDKYILHHYDIEPMESCVILPGSNLLQKQVIKVKLNGAADLGAKIKPHPLTSEHDLQRLNNEYRSAVLPSMYSGFNVMKASKYVFSTGASELGLYAMLLGKYVIDISNRFPGGGYWDIFKACVGADDQKGRLNYLLNHPGAGIIMPDDDYKEKISQYLDHYQRVFSEFEKIHKR